MCVQKPCAESTPHHFLLTFEALLQKKLMQIQTKTILQPCRTTATLNDTELQTDGQSEELQRTRDKDGAFYRRVMRRRFRRRTSNRVHDPQPACPRLLPFFAYRCGGSLSWCHQFRLASWMAGVADERDG